MDKFLETQLPKLTQQERGNFNRTIIIPWWLRQLRICLQCRRLGSFSGLGRSPEEKGMAPPPPPNAPVFFPREFRGQRSLVGYSPRGRKESNMTEQLIHTHNNK